MLGVPAAIVSCNELNNHEHVCARSQDTMRLHIVRFHPAIVKLID